MATDFTSFNKQPQQLGLGGAAMRKMQELAQQLYDSTPGLQEEIPRHTSKILLNVKKEDHRAEKRAHAFLSGGESTSGGHPVRRGGTIEKKDLTIAMTAEDWETKYKEIWDKYKEEKSRTKELKERMVKKQERYIAREHEYRGTIDQIEKEIDLKSTKPLEIIHEHDENQLLLMGVDPSQPEQQELMERERKQKLKNDMHIDQKKVKAIHQYYDKLHDTLKVVQEGAAKDLWRQRQDIWKTLDQKLDEIKQQLKAETEKKKEDQYDFKEKEKELNEHLETMTQIAQKIDDENRSLMKKNSDLKIQYLSQENDRDLLLRQLIVQKKENQRLRKVLEDSKKAASECGPIGLDDHPATLNMDQSRAQLPPKKPLHQGRQSQNNLSGLNNSRRNISLSSANMFAGRPKTAAMVGGLPRPPTAYQGPNPGGKKTNMTTMHQQQQNFNFVGAGIRANSVQIANNPKIQRYEDLIFRLKKMLSLEKKSLRMVKTMCSKEIEMKNGLEKILRACVDDVKSEIAKKRSENKSIYYAKGKKGQSDLLDEKNLTQQEREKIIEVLLSQERVLTLLYDKTFPPRPATAKVGLKNAFSALGHHNDTEQMRQFNYYGQVNNNETDEVEEADVERLEREIEEVLKNRSHTAANQNDLSGAGKYSNGIVNINQKGGMRHKSAAQAGYPMAKRNLMSAAYRQNRGNDYTADMGADGDIYEDDESSQNDEDDDMD